MGSPPRGRGKGDGASGVKPCAGITPAWAGKRSGLPKRSMTVRDHPRVGGEKERFVMPLGLELGSPPRGRGKEKIKDLQQLLARITPAWAGKRGMEAREGDVGGDHPRVGGEKSSARHTRTTATGSPPRGRGKVCKETQPGADHGITPAWAGKSAQRLGILTCAGDHPRVGGEKPSP